MSLVFRKQLPAFVLAFLVPLVAVYWWWGGFAGVELTQVEASAYRYAYLDYEGRIDNMRKTQNQVYKAFEDAKVEPGDSITVLETDPRSDDHGHVRARVGYVLPPGAAIPSDLKAGELAPRPVIRASVQAVVLLAPSKAYEAVSEAYGNEAIRMPTVELYRPSGKASGTGVFTLEVPR